MFIIKNIPAMKHYIEMFMSDDMIGDDSILSEIGLISLPSSEKEKTQNSVLQGTKLSINDLKKH